MKLRTFEGEPIRGEMTTDFPASQDGIPVLLVKDEPFSPEEAEFFIEYATQEEMEMLREGGYDLPAWEERDEVGRGTPLSNSIAGFCIFCRYLLGKLGELLLPRGQTPKISTFHPQHHSSNLLQSVTRFRR